MIVSFIKTSFDVLLKLHEVMQHGELTTVPADGWTEFTIGEEQAGFYYETTGWAMLRGQ